MDITFYPLPPGVLRHAYLHPPRSDQIVFFRSWVCTGAHRHPAACGTNQGILKRRFAPSAQVGSNRLVQALTIYWRTPESSGLQCKSRYLKKAVCSHSGGQCPLGPVTHAVSHLSDVIYLLISFRKSTPTQNRQIDILISTSKQ
jgi:hypothetical protein